MGAHAVEPRIVDATMRKSRITGTARHRRGAAETLAHYCHVRRRPREGDAPVHSPDDGLQTVQGTRDLDHAPVDLRPPPGLEGRADVVGTLLELLGLLARPIHIFG